MTVTFQDKLGVVAVRINKQYGITFGVNIEDNSTRAWFTDEEENDYIVETKHLISITEE